MATVAEFREALKQMRSAADGAKAFGERVVSYRVQAIVLGYQVADDIMLKIDDKALSLRDVCVDYAYSKDRGMQTKYKEAFAEQLLDIDPEAPRRGAIGQMSRNLMLGIAELVALNPLVVAVVDNKIDIGKKAEGTQEPILFSSNALIANAVARHRDTTPTRAPTHTQSTAVASSSWEATISSFHSKIAGLTLDDVPKTHLEALRDLHIDLMIMFREQKPKQQMPPRNLRLVSQK